MDTAVQTKAWLILFPTILLTACVSNQFQALDQPLEPSVYTSTTTSKSVTSGRTQSTGGYTVQEGDTLYTIALKNELDYRKLAAANGINEPYRIYIGQELQLSELSVRSQKNNSNTSVVTSGNAGNVTISTPSLTPDQTRPSASQEISAAQLTWVRPHDGKVLNSFQNGSPYGKGIDIVGSVGDGIRAVADGKVVYSGNGLRAYGNLILIQHDGNLLSAYAFLSRSHVSERQSIKAGDVIADIGEKESAYILHLEIRRDGKPIDPESLLPQQ